MRVPGKTERLTRETVGRHRHSLRVTVEENPTSVPVHIYSTHKLIRISFMTWQRWCLLLVLDDKSRHEVLGWSSARALSTRGVSRMQGTAAATRRPGSAAPEFIHENTEASVVAARESTTMCVYHCQL